MILKEGSSARQQLEQLESLRGTLPPAVEKQLEADIRAVKAGIVGEDRILYELKNSHMEMYVLQDLFLEHEGLTAQIDFLVITLQRSFVIECKNLYGDITVTERGDFVRNLGGRKREGVYSPITQNQRHIDLIHAMKRAYRSTLSNLINDADFDDVYRGLVVLANPKTVLDDRHANPEVKKLLIRADQLISTIKSINSEKGIGREKAFRFAVRENAEWFLAQHKECPVDYAAKYRTLIDERAVEGPAVAASAQTYGQAVDQSGGQTGSRPADQDSGQMDSQTVMCPRCGAPMVLRTARRGKWAGKQFYGCSKYPSCRGIVNVGE